MTLELVSISGLMGTIGVLGGMGRGIAGGDDAGRSTVLECAGEAAARDVCGGVGVGRFLVASFAALETHDALEVPWLDASGREVRLGI